MSKSFEELEKDIILFGEIREYATLNFSSFDEFENELKEIDEKLYEYAWFNHWSSVEAFDYFEKKLNEKMKKIGSE